MSLTFRLKHPLTLPVDVAAIRLGCLQGLTATEVAQLPVWHGNRSIACGELFEISGSPDDELLVWIGDCRKVKSIGAGLSHGTIRVEGDAGMWLGEGMSGGEICVIGNSGDWTGAEMRGGRIEIRGSAGDHIGGSRPGSKRGMTGGEILIHGDAGDAAGVRMRRGLIAVSGSIGASAAAGMIAGTIVAGGDCGPEPGRGMKRGTLLFLKPDLPAPSVTGFELANVVPLTFVQLYLRHLRSTGMLLPEISSETSFRLYRGDALELGLGEILVPTSGH